VHLQGAAGVIKSPAFAAPSGGISGGPYVLLRQLPMSFLLRLLSGIRTGRHDPEHGEQPWTGPLWLRISARSLRTVGFGPWRRCP